MAMSNKIARRFRQAGVRGVVSSGLRHVADRIQYSDPGGMSLESEGEFLKWVRFAVPGMLDPGNVVAMDHAIANMPAGKPVIEIGSFCGLSTVVISHLLEIHSQQSRLFTCDRWEFEGQEMGSLLGESRTVTHDQYQKYVKETYLRSTRAFTGERLPHTIECFSDEFFELWSKSAQEVDVYGRDVTLGGDIGFSFIDGNHTYDFARRDFENSDRFLVSGGFILFDDSGDDTDWEVNRLVREIVKRRDYSLVSRNPNYMFRKN